MVTAHDVHTVTFEKAMRGYSVEQVDEFLDKVASQIEQDESKTAELNQSVAEQQAKAAELQKKIEEQEKKLEGYISYEDALKSALLNAQRMGENVIREAKQKAEAIVREANIRADDITRAAETQTKDQEIELARIKGEVAQFKSNVLSLYKAHIESLSTLPEDDTASEEGAEVLQNIAVEPTVAEADEQNDITETFAPDAPVAEVQDEVSPAFSFPAKSSIVKPEEENSFWDKDERELTSNAPIAPEQTDAAPAESTDSLLDQAAQEEPVPQHAEPLKPETFRGISFSD